MSLMSWKSLLQKPESVVGPWLGGRALHAGSRAFTVDGPLPPEHGWHAFDLTGRKARWTGAAEPQPDTLDRRVQGYLVGDRIVPDDARVVPDPGQIADYSERVHLIEPGLDRFARVSAGRAFEGGPLVYREQVMPLGPESDVLGAFLDGAESVDSVPGVAPALDAAFRLEAWRRAEAVRRRAELERRRREEEERLAREKRREELVQQLGDGAGRRRMAAVDFEEAARAALAVGGAVYLDHRATPRRREVAVRFRLEGRRYECVCEEGTLRITDAGICLVDHDTGEKGDTWLTLESLPAVIREADREGRLVVFRHVD
jgi:hypothetical protein